MPRTSVTVTFTAREIRALRLAASECMEHPDIAQGTFPCDADLLAADRAYAKVQRADARARAKEARSASA